MARYEKSIASRDYVWNITITQTPTTIYDLLPTSAKQALDSLSAQVNIVDGYVVSYLNNFNVTRAHEDAGVELVVSYQQYTCPFENWPLFVMVYVNAPLASVDASVRVFTGI